MKFTPTQEQLDCIEAAKQHKQLKILASAGSGKSSTLALISEQIIEPSVYLAFNKSTALDASKRFPSHVNAMTTHSAAYRECGISIQHKLSRPVGRYVNVAGTGSEIAKFFKLEAAEGITANGVGLLVKRTVERFEQSADAKIDRKHVPTWEIPEGLKNNNSFKDYVFKHAKKLWNKRIEQDSFILATHDTYLKMFQLSKPKLTGKVLYVDEFHDTTDCVLDIVRNQGHMKIIVVGDNYQNIYQFRGAKNALDDFDVYTCHLTQSFRYGQAVADVANSVLQGKTSIRGFDKVESIVGRNTVDTTKPYMHIFRTNSALIMSAISSLEKGVPTLIAIDTRDFVKLLQSALALSKGIVKDVKHERILPFAEFKDLVEEGKIDGELGRIASAVKDGRAYKMIDMLEHYTAPKDPVATFTTCHKVKGAEAEQVILDEDFPSHYGRKGAWVGLSDSERNLLYVGATRAKLVLEINTSVEEAIEAMQVGRWNKDENLKQLIKNLTSDISEDYDDEYENLQQY